MFVHGVCVPLVSVFVISCSVIEAALRPSGSRCVAGLFRAAYVPSDLVVGRVVSDTDLYLIKGSVIFPFPFFLIYSRFSL